MQPTVDELVSALVLNPTLAYQVVRELCETSIAGPWEPGEGIENGYERTWIRRHISGISNVACVGRGTGSTAAWWTLDSEVDYAGSLLLARAAADAHLVEQGWTLADRGIATQWIKTDYCWHRRAENSARTIIARAWGSDTTGRYTIEDFGLSSDGRGIAQARENLPSLEHAKAAADEVLVKQWWTLTKPVICPTGRRS